MLQTFYFKNEIVFPNNYNTFKNYLLILSKGVPFTTKESTAVEGLSYTFGLTRRKGRKATFDADYVTLMKKAGGICLGKRFKKQNSLSSI